MNVCTVDTKRAFYTFIDPPHQYPFYRRVVEELMVEMYCYRLMSILITTDLCPRRRHFEPSAGY